jgi:hypothetical protein
VMLVVMKLQRLGGHEWGERIVGVGEWGKLERHGGLRRCFASGLPGIAARYRLGTGKTSQGRTCCSDAQNGRGPGPLKIDTLPTHLCSDLKGIARSARLPQGPMRNAARWRRRASTGGAPRGASPRAGGGVCSGQPVRAHVRKPVLSARCERGDLCYIPATARVQKRVSRR